MSLGSFVTHATLLGVVFSLALSPPHLWGAEAGRLEVEGLVRPSSTRPFANPPQPGVFKVGAPSDQLEALRGEGAVPLYVHEAGLPAIVSTTAATVERALAQGGIEVYPGDLVLPAPETPLRAGIHVYLFRAREVTLHAAGAIRSVRTRAKTVRGVLEAEGLSLGPLDRVEPDPAGELHTGMSIKVVAVQEELVELVEPLGFATDYLADPELELDEQAVVQEGSPGSARQLLRVRYEDGQEASHIIERAWLDPEPRDRVIRYGTKIVVRTLAMPEGEVRYWRKLRVYTTWYNAGGGGKPRGHPLYGITRTGMVVTKGVVAVDPRVIPLLAEMYVPGYGVAVAGDTGGGVKGRVIDLGFDEAEVSPWKPRWVDVYLLTPVPPPEAIPWVLP